MNTDRSEMVQIIVKHDFGGIIAEHRTDPIFRRVLSIGALSCWHMYGFKDKQKLKEHALAKRTVVDLLRFVTGFPKRSDALVYSEHSWG